MGRHGTQAEEKWSSPAARQRGGGGCRGQLRGEDCGTHCNWLARCLEPLLLWDKHLSVMEMRSQGDRTPRKETWPSFIVAEGRPKQIRQTPADRGWGERSERKGLEEARQ